MVRNIQLTAGILSGFIFLSSACQSLNIPGNKINTSNTPLVSETLAIPTEIPPTPTITEIPPTPTQENYKVSEIDKMEMIYITGGEFIMGTEDIEAQRILEGNGRQYAQSHSRWILD
jgi:hypothetical protein